MRSPERALALGELALLAGVALAALGFHLWLPGRLPSEADHRAAAEVLAREARPGDAVLLFPWWTERARLFAPPGLPVVGYLGSDGDALRAHPRVWVLSQPELPRADVRAFEAAFLPQRTPEGPPRRFGPLVLQAFRNGRHAPARFDAVEAVARARVSVEGPDGARTPCTWDGTAHRCPGGTPAHGPGLRVAAEWHELLYQPRRCLWLQPPGGARRLVAEFDGVPGGTRLVLEGGITWEHAHPREPGLAVTHFGADAEGAQLALAVPPGREGVLRDAVALPDGPPRTVRLWSQADRAERRALCVELVALAEGAP